MSVITARALAFSSAVAKGCIPGSTTRERAASNCKCGALPKGASRRQGNGFSYRSAEGTESAIC